MLLLRPGDGEGAAARQRLLLISPACQLSSADDIGCGDSQQPCSCAINPQASSQPTKGEPPSGVPTSRWWRGVAIGARPGGAAPTAGCVTLGRFVWIAQSSSGLAWTPQPAGNEVKGVGVPIGGSGHSSPGAGCRLINDCMRLPRHTQAQGAGERHTSRDAGLRVWSAQWLVGWATHGRLLAGGVVEVPKEKKR